jgi:hypothetical protein
MAPVVENFAKRTPARPIEMYLSYAVLPSGSPSPLCVMWRIQNMGCGGVAKAASSMPLTAGRCDLWTSV